MSRRTHHFVPLAAAGLAIALAGAAAAADAPPVARTGKPADRAKEVVVLVSVTADGMPMVTPDTAYVRSGQKLVLVTCCDELHAKFVKKVERVPDFECRKARECTLVGPAVSKPTTATYAVWGTCNGKPFGKDPILIFIP